MEQVENLSRRIQSVVSLAAYWRDTMPKKPRKKGEGSEWREWTGLIIVLEKFLKFANDYVKLLNNAPIPNQRFIMNRGVENLLQGFSVLSRACEQRRGVITTDSLGYYLAQAEDMLEGYCTQWQAGNFASPYLKLTTPVVYFEKLFGIARSVYTPEIPIVSIPLTMYNDPYLWLALAHEMGHHIFWNALDSLNESEKFHNHLYSAIKGSVSENSAGVWQGWAEEVFADICGVLLAGPDYVISCQDTAAERAKNLADLAKNDGEHPCPYLRPIIAAQVLREIANHIKDDNLWNALAKIELRWENFSQDAGDQPVGKNLKLADLSAEVQSVAQAILHQPIWPGEKKLWDLIRYFGTDPYQVHEIVDLKNLNVSDLLPPTLSQRYPRITGPRDEDIPESMKNLWEFLRERLSVSEPSGLTQWDKLLDLRLDENHGHWLVGNAHTDCRTHVVFPLHRHNQDTGAVIEC